MANFNAGQHNQKPIGIFANKVGQDLDLEELSKLKDVIRCSKIGKAKLEAIPNAIKLIWLLHEHNMIHENDNDCKLLGKYLNQIGRNDLEKKLPDIWQESMKEANGNDKEE
ncbi:uncharacterized protein LOC144354685 [Saccoglossus kowalevskii]